VRAEEFAQAVLFRWFAKGEEIFWVLIKGRAISLEDREGIAGRQPFVYVVEDVVECFVCLL
jgi:hypothetical protein